jgi:hypothetical protein
MSGSDQIPSKREGTTLTAHTPPSMTMTHGGVSDSDRFPSEREGTTSAAHSPSLSKRRSIAVQNEGLKSVKEDPANLATWDSWHYHWLKLWSDFGNWNNRRLLKNINASPEVLNTYHDSFLFGEVPVSVRARSTLRSGAFGAIWNLVKTYSL